MPTTQLPGFESLTHDSQKTFRAVLDALANPGQIQLIAVQLSSPIGLNLACAAACLSLFDLETLVWLQPGFSEAVKNWLRFHTGCRFTDKSNQATFSVIHSLPKVTLEQFCWGTAEAPETSTTLLVQVDRLAGDRTIVLTGPGILTQQTISPQIPESFWPSWQRNHQAYPRGVDIFFLNEASTIGLPRTASTQLAQSRHRTGEQPCLT
ncbi:MAG: phosphonate C-P lyase system protein PhnH [Phormidesmis sp.]